MMRPPNPHPGAPSANTVSPEPRFLAAALRAAVEPDVRIRPADWGGEGLCWGKVVRLARRHCVVPLLRRGLDRHGGLCPPQTLQQLALHAAANVLRNRALAGLLAELQSLLAAEGIPVAPLKGPVMAQELYGDAGLRECHDLDLLVPEECMRRAGKALQEAGWSPLRHEGEALAFARGEAPAPVELHAQVSPRSFARPLVDSGVWERMKPAILNGNAFSILAPDDLLLLLCVHGAKHHWTRLDWVLDVHVLARRLDPERLLALDERARRRGVARMLRTGLLLSQALFGTSLPPEPAARAAEDAVAASLARLARDYLLSGREEEPHARTIHCYRVKMQEFPADQLRYSVYAAGAMAHAMLRPNRRDREWLRLPRRWSGLYLLLRPFRIVARYLPVAQAGRRLKNLPREP